VEALAQALRADRVDAEVETYPGTKHGFAFPQRPVYDRSAAERHWERLNSLFRRKLG
jgi:carboxymethylenebutenolidase